MTELAHRGLVRHWLPPQIDAHKLPHHHRVVERLFQPRVRQVEPLLQKVHSQHPLQPHRGPPVACFWIVRLDQPTQLAPRHNLFHFLQKQSALGLLGVPFKASHHRQCPLFHVFHAGANLTYTPCGKGELNQSLLNAIQQTIRYLRGTYEFVVIDCSQGVGNANEATIAECDEFYLVATPDVPALRDLSRYVDRLLQYNLPAGKVKVAINRSRSRGEVALKEISEAVRLPVSISIPNSSEELIMAMNTGKPIAMGSRSDFAKQMRKWATDLAGSAVENGTGTKRSFAFWK